MDLALVMEVPLGLAVEDVLPRSMSCLVLPDHSADWGFLLPLEGDVPAVLAV